MRPRLPLYTHYYDTDAGGLLGREQSVTDSLRPIFGLSLMVGMSQRRGSLLGSRFLLGLGSTELLSSNYTSIPLGHRALHSRDSHFVCTYSDASGQYICIYIYMLPWRVLPSCLLLQARRPTERVLHLQIISLLRQPGLGDVMTDGIPFVGCDFRLLRQPSGRPALPCFVDAALHLRSYQGNAAHIGLDC